MRKHENFEDLEWVKNALYKITIALCFVIILLVFLAYTSVSNVSPQKQAIFKESTHYKCDTLGVKTNYFK